MLDNNVYNLMAQMVEENQSLWRIKNAYKKDAAACGECQDFWSKMESEKENKIRELGELIKSHM